MLTSLFLYESIRTTKKSAQYVRPLAEKLITISKKKEPYLAIRMINKYVNDKNASRKLMEVLKERYATRSSGYTRMVALGSRKGDGAMLVTLELIGAGDTDAATKTPKIPKSPRTSKTSGSSKT